MSREGKNGQRKRLGSYCRFFQTKPCHSKSMLCVGFYSFPPCPDLHLCKAKPAKSKKSVEVLPEGLLQEDGA